jgi:Uma2 family endonuclease
MNNLIPTQRLDDFWLKYGYKPFELLAGQIVPLKKLSFQQSIILLRVTTLLEQYVVQHDLGEVVGANCGFALTGDTLRSPRAAFIGQSKWDSVRYPYRYFPFAPDLVIEALDTTNKPAQRDTIQHYLAAGTQMIWLLDADRQQVMVHITGGKYRIFGYEETLLGWKIIPGLRLPVASLFPRQKKTP